MNGNRPSPKELDRLLRFHGVELRRDTVDLLWAFHRIRDAYIRRHGSVKGGRWIWNNGSTMTSQLIDTAAFITLAFYGTVPNLFSMILSQYAVKLIYAALDTIPFYLLTNRHTQEVTA